jgi:hypothetical protein
LFSSIQVQRFSVGSIFKLFAIASASSLVPLSVLMGVFAAFSARTVTWNGEHLVGMTGLLVSPFIGLFLTLLFTAIFGTFFVIGLWIFSKFRPLKLSAKGVVVLSSPEEKSN